jgi:hypothetical protein
MNEKQVVMVDAKIKTSHIDGKKGFVEIYLDEEDMFNGAED